MSRQTFVVVGASLSGASAAAALRAEGFDGRVVLVGTEPELPYERPPLSKEYLRGEVPLDKAFVRPESFYAENAIELRLGVRAERVDPAGRAVELAGGARLSYDKLLLATGARNRRLPVPGTELDGVLDLRTAADAGRIREEARPGRRAVVAGLGFIGSEVAASLRQLGLDVTAVEMLATPLEPALGVEVGRTIAELHRDHGVELVLGDGVGSFEGDGRVREVVTASGRRIECDFAVVGVGVAPAVEVVAGTGVELDGGIAVDELCRTSVPGIYAAGDVAAHVHPLAGRRIRVEHWQNAIRQGEAAALSMLGRGAPYDEVHWFWSDQYDANLQYAGFHGPWDELVVRGSLEERSFVAFYLREGRVQAAAALNRGKDLRRAIALVRAGAAPDPAALRDPDTDLRTLAP